MTLMFEDVDTKDLVAASSNTHTPYLCAVWEYFLEQNKQMTISPSLLKKCQRAMFLSATTEVLIFSEPMFSAGSVRWKMVNASTFAASMWNGTGIHALGCNLGRIAQRLYGSALSIMAQRVSDKKNWVVFARANCVHAWLVHFILSYL